MLKPTLLGYFDETKTDKLAFMAACKQDWYDQDRLFLRENSAFRAFCMYKDIKNFPNIYMDFFPRQAFESRKNDIVRFYTEDCPLLEREHLYFTKEQADTFVKECAAAIATTLQDSYGVAVFPREYDVYKEL